MDQQGVLSVAGVRFAAFGGAVGQDQDVGVLLTSGAATGVGSFPPHGGTGGPSIPCTGQHQVLPVAGHISKTHWLCRRWAWRRGRRDGSVQEEEKGRRKRRDGEKKKRSSRLKERRKRLRKGR